MLIPDCKYATFISFQPVFVSKDTIFIVSDSFVIISSYDIRRWTGHIPGGGQLITYMDGRMGGRT
jgi:hypothetical protein